MRRRKPRNTATGERNGNHVLTVARIAASKRMRRRGWKWTEIAELYGCTETTVRRACRGQTWRALA